MSEYLSVRAGGYALLLPSAGVRGIGMLEAAPAPLPPMARMPRDAALVDAAILLGGGGGPGRVALGWVGDGAAVRARLVVDAVDRLVVCAASELLALPRGFIRHARLFAAVWRAPGGALLPCLRLDAALPLRTLRAAALRGAE